VAIAMSLAACTAAGRDRADVAAVELDARDVDRYEVPSRNHVADAVDYPQSPPVGGDHAESGVSCGVYEEPLDEERAVHALEHGAVWITYDPLHDPRDIEDLEARADGSTHVLVSPYPEQVDPIILSAWGAQMSALFADDPRIDAFVAEVLGRSEAPEPGTSCSE